LTGPTRAKLAVVGIGNTLAGDDGVGVVAIRQLEVEWSGHRDVILCTLEGDLLAVSELLPQAERFLFLDSVSGEQPGGLVMGVKAGRAYAPSFHQTDIATVMQQMESLGMADPFPAWEIWGVIIRPPAEVKEGLSPAVAAGVEELVRRVSLYIARKMGAGD